MKNDLIALDQLQQNNPAQPEVHRTSHAKNMFNTGAAAPVLNIFLA